MISSISSGLSRIGSVVSSAMKWSAGVAGKCGEFTFKAFFGSKRADQGNEATSRESSDSRESSFSGGNFDSKRADQGNEADFRESSFSGEESLGNSQGKNSKFTFKALFGFKRADQVNEADSRESSLNPAERFLKVRGNTRQ